MYAYVHGPDSFTCYRPFAEGDNKFRKHNIEGHVMGWNELPYIGEQVVVTKSLKDIMVFDKLGVPAVSMHSEHQGFPEEKMSILKDMFDTVIVVYDNDNVGIGASQKLSAMWNIKEWRVPERFTGCKDISDLIKKIGPNETNYLWKQQSQCLMTNN